MKTRPFLFHSYFHLIFRIIEYCDCTFLKVDSPPVPVQQSFTTHTHTHTYTRERDREREGEGDIEREMGTGHRN